MEGQTSLVEVEVRYTRGKREKSLDAVFECSHDKFMRLQYMLGHPSLFKQKCEQLKTKNVPDISIDEQEGRKVLVINVGVITDFVSDTEKEQLTKKVVEEILKDTGNLVVNSFPTSGIDKDKAASMMNEMSKKEMGHDLWLYTDEESDCIHYVCPKSRVQHVEGLIKEVTDMCEEERELVLNLDQLKVKEKAEEHMHDSDFVMDADQLDNASEDVEQSIEIFPEGHQHSEEEDNSSDSIESETRQEENKVALIVSYKRKVGKWRDFIRLLEIPLMMESHLKWKYITCNVSLLQQMLSKIQPFTERIDFRDGHLEVSIGKQKSDPDFDQLSKKIEEIILENTDSIVISWFPIPHTEVVDVQGILIRTLNASDIGQKSEIYTETASNGLIRLVYKEKQESAVTALLAKTMKTIKEIQHSDNISDTVTLPGVKSQVFHHFQVRPTAKKLYPDVEIAIDVVESKEEFVVSMRGPKSQVGEVKDWMINNYDKPYSCVEVPFHQLDMLNEFNDVPRLLEDTLANQPDVLLFWTVNRYTKKVWYCSKEKDVLQKAVADYKTCLKEKSFSTDLLSLGEAEESIYKLTRSNSLQEKKISFEVKVKQGELQFRLTGPEDQLNTYTQEVEEYLKEECPSQNTGTRNAEPNGGGMFGTHGNTCGGLFGTSSHQSGVGSTPSTTASTGGFFGPSFESTPNTKANKGGISGFGFSPSTTANTGGLFGTTPSTTANTGGMFGTTPSTTANTGGLFGTTPSTTANTGGLFGTTPSTTANTGGMFGTTPSTTANTGGMFGTTPSTTAKSGGFSAFGSTPSTTANTGEFSGFGTTPSTTANTGEVSGFGSTPSTTANTGGFSGFGTTPSTTANTGGFSGFGTTPSTTANTGGFSGFGSSSNTTANTGGFSSFGTTPSTTADTGGFSGFSSTPSTTGNTGGFSGFGSTPSTTANTGGFSGFDSRPSTTANTGGFSGFGTTPKTTANTGGFAGFDYRPSTTANTGGFSGFYSRPSTTANTGGFSGFYSRPSTTANTGGFSGFDSRPSTTASTGGFSGFASTPSTTANTGGFSGFGTTPSTTANTDRSSGLVFGSTPSTTGKRGGLFSGTTSSTR